MVIFEYLTILEGHNEGHNEECKSELKADDYEVIFRHFEMFVNNIRNINISKCGKQIIMTSFKKCMINGC